MRRADGEWRHVSARGAPVMNDQGEITEWVGIHTDVTARKMAAQLPAGMFPSP